MNKNKIRDVPNLVYLKNKFFASEKIERIMDLMDSFPKVEDWILS